MASKRIKLKKELDKDQVIINALRKFLTLIIILIMDNFCFQAQSFKIFSKKIGAY